MRQFILFYCNSSLASHFPFYGPSVEWLPMVSACACACVCVPECVCVCSCMVSNIKQITPTARTARTTTTRRHTDKSTKHSADAKGLRCRNPKEGQTPTPYNMVTQTGRGRVARSAEWKTVEYCA